MIQQPMDKSSNLYIQDFNGQAPGLYKVIHGFDESILQQACVMQILTNILHELNNLITNLSNKMKNSDIASAKTFFAFSVLSTVVTIGTIGIAGSFVYYSEPIEIAGSTKLQKFHQMLAGFATKAEINLLLTTNLMKAVYASKKGQYTSTSMKIQSANSQLEPLVDSFGKTMDSCTQAISSETKATKTILEKDYSSKAKGLYFYKL